VVTCNKSGEILAATNTIFYGVWINLSIERGLINTLYNPRPERISLMRKSERRLERLLERRLERLLERRLERLLERRLERLLERRLERLLERRLERLLERRLERLLERLLLERREVSGPHTGSWYINSLNPKFSASQTAS
jgi:hypothetical protein